MDNERARRFAEQWYDAWNAHDLEAIVSVGGRIAAETVFLDGNDKVTRYFAHHDG